MGEQTWSAQGYEKNARYVSDLAGPVIELLAPEPGERILDLGCGDGVLTRRLADGGCELVGIDSSPELIEAALGLGLDVSLQDACDLRFDEEFDAVFSNAVLHWIREPDRVIRNVFRALRPGGRFVAECGGHACVETIRQALIAALDERGLDGRAGDPWYFPTAEDYRGRLEAAGFGVGYIEIVPRPTPLAQGMMGFLDTFAGSFASMLPAGERAGYLADVCTRLAPALRDADGNWTADYTRLRFAARKPA